MARFQVARISVLLLLLLLVPCATQKAIALPATSTGSDSAHAIQSEFVDLTYLAGHLAEFENRSITTNGTVRFYASIYMFEDFWLQDEGEAKVLVVTRFSGLPVPENGSFVEISGRIEHSNLEGGFYFLNAASLTVPVLSEFSPDASIFLFLFALCAAAVLVGVKVKRME
jgi:hypothetical protein